MAKNTVNVLLAQLIFSLVDTMFLEAHLEQQKEIILKDLIQALHLTR